MKDHDCVDFLRWALPQLHLDWPGFKKVRSQVCKRVQQRMRMLCIDSVDAYRAYLMTYPDEWDVLDEFCYISISRFYRDCGVFDYLGQSVLPALAQQAIDRDAPSLQAWSAGCGSGEEPYSLTIMWHLALKARFPNLELEVMATDASETMLARAQQAHYCYSSVKELPQAWRASAFITYDDVLELRPAYRSSVSLRQEDIRRTMPSGPFDLVLCRNLVCTYFDTEMQIKVMGDLAERIRPGGALVIGSHEQLPSAALGLTPWSEPHHVYRKVA